MLHELNDKKPIERCKFLQINFCISLNANNLFLVRKKFQVNICWIICRRFSIPCLVQFGFCASTIWAGRKSSSLFKSSSSPSSGSSTFNVMHKFSRRTQVWMILQQRFGVYWRVPPLLWRQRHRFLRRPENSYWTIVLTNLKLKLPLLTSKCK